MLDYLPKGVAILAIFTFLNVLLLARYDIPKNDVAACTYALVAVLVATTFDFPSAEIHKSKRFLTSFRTLTMLEAFLTLIVPWRIIVLENLHHSTFPSDKNVGYLLAPHLLVFQAQIALEQIIFMSGQKWLLLPYTCAANAYRAVPLARWIARSLEILPELSPRGWEWTVLAVLPAMATVLWIASTFVFIPFIWYPPWKQAGHEAAKKREEEKLTDW